MRQVPAPGRRAVSKAACRCVPPTNCRTRPRRASRQANAATGRSERRCVVHDESAAASTTSARAPTDAGSGRAGSRGRGGGGGGGAGEAPAGRPGGRGGGSSEVARRRALEVGEGGGADDGGDSGQAGRRPCSIIGPRTACLEAFLTPTAAGTAAPAVRIREQRFDRLGVRQNEWAAH